MNRIKIMTDSACDIPADLEAQLNIKILCFPITVGDVGYIERVDFTNEEFYNILMTEPKIPVTSQITQMQFMQEYNDVLAEGYKELIYVPINGKGSNTLNSAIIARKAFYEKHSESELKIHIVDSRTYAIAYGYPVIEAAKKVQKGATSAEIIPYLEDWFDSVEIYFAPYTLQFVKKSGRVSCAAAFAGELIGLRPIISIIDGVTKIEEKVRGDKSIIPALLKYAKTSAVPQTPYLIISSMLVDEANALAEQAKKLFGYETTGIFPTGAAITINAGPKVIAIIVKGKRRNSDK